MTRVLLLGGTAEARKVADELALLPGLSPIASLAGATRTPEQYAVPVRRGGFGGADGLRNWLRRQSCGAVLDATHPYAERMQANAMTATASLGVPYLRLLRPAWAVRPGWVEVADAASAAGHLPPEAQVLLTSGRKELEPFYARRDVTYFLRSIEAVRDLPSNVRPILARPPFTLEGETAFLKDRAISHLVTKNAGGSGTAKLDAADSMGLTTIVIRRPPMPDCTMTGTVDGAVAWLRNQVAFAG